MVENVILVNPSDKAFLENAGDRPPLGLMQISSYLKQHDYATRIIDLNHDSINELYDSITIPLQGPEAVMFSVSTPNYQQCVNLAQTVRATRPDITLIAGGAHVTDIPTEPLTLQTYDYVVVGEGEVATREILEGKHPKGIVKEIKADPDTLPYPDYEAVRPLERYTMTIDGKRATTVVTSKGCRFSCFYCGSAGTGWRPRSPYHVVEELEMLHNLGYKAFYFADDIFSYRFQRVFDICRLIKERLPQISWRATTRASLLTADMCLAMADAGCKVVSIGLESGSNKVLKVMKKQTTIEIQERGLRYCKEAGIKVKAFFIFPLPAEDEQTAEETLAFAKRLKSEGLISWADIYTLAPYPNTPFWKNPEEYGITIILPKDSDWNSYFQTSQDPKIVHPNFTTQQIKDYIKRFKEEIGLPGMTA